jgi:hypothetical protein
MLYKIKHEVKAKTRPPFSALTGKEGLEDLLMQRFVDSGAIISVLKDHLFPVLFK